MTDAQNERTETRRKRRGRGPKRHNQRREQPAGQSVTSPNPVSDTPTEVPQPAPAKFIRPNDIEPPTERMELYCTHHLALQPDEEPMQVRSNAEMTTLRHLQVDHFGEATLFCDCLHNGPHEWPPSLQRVESALELDQFLTDSTSEA